MFFRPIRQKKARAVEDIFKVFAKLVFQGKLSAAIKLLDSESSTGLLNLTPEVLEGLKEKHPEEADIAGPSGRDAELYRRILCSKNFKTEGKILREEIAVFTRNLFKIAYHPSLLEGYTSCRLIPRDKNRGIRPIGVGEVLRRTVGKTIAGFLKEEIKDAAGPLEVCADHSAGSEAAIHDMSQVFVEEGRDGILLIDTTNTFNQRNRSVALHNIQITCKEISLYIINTYRSPSRLFICDGGEIITGGYDAGGSLGHALVLGQYISHDPELKDKHKRC